LHETTPYQKDALCPCTCNLQPEVSAGHRKEKTHLAAEWRNIILGFQSESGSGRLLRELAPTRLHVLFCVFLKVDVSRARDDRFRGPETSRNSKCPKVAVFSWTNHLFAGSHKCKCSKFRASQESLNGLADASPEFLRLSAGWPDQSLGHDNQHGHGPGPGNKSKSPRTSKLELTSVGQTLSFSFSTQLRHQTNYLLGYCEI
jgi:hypothetical protein